jgi:hypothetical protein
LGLGSFRIEIFWVADYSANAITTADSVEPGAEQRLLLVGEVKLLLSTPCGLPSWAYARKRSPCDLGRQRLSSSPTAKICGRIDGFQLKSLAQTGF